MRLSEADRQILNLLAQDGDNHAIPRMVEHFFYGERAPLEEIANRLESEGWYDLELARGEDDFRLIARTKSDMHEASIILMMAQIQASMDGFEITYDGWETSLERSN